MEIKNGFSVLTRELYKPSPLIARPSFSWNKRFQWTREIKFTVRPKPANHLFKEIEDVKVGFQRVIELLVSQTTNLQEFR